MMTNAPFIAVLAMLLSMTCYQISASFAKQLIVTLDPLSVTILRLCFASILVFIMFRSWKVLSKLSTLKWHNLLCYSGALCVMNVLFYMSLGKLPQGIAVGLEFIGPLGLALLSIQQRRDYIWVFCAILGIGLMVPWQQTTQADFSVSGAAFALGAGFCWALYIYYGHKVVRQNIGMHALTIAITLSAIVLLPIGLVHQPDHILNPESWYKALIIAILATVIPYAMDLFALKRLSKMSYGTLSSLSPALAALAGLILLHEQISFLQWIALGCIMLASVGVTFRAKTENDLNNNQAV